MKLDMPFILNPDKLIDVAFRKASKEASSLSIKKVSKLVRVRKKEEKKIKSVSSTIKKHLNKVISRTPKVDELPPFYRELINVVVGIDRFKKSLGAIKWAVSKIKYLERYYSYKVRTSREEKEVYRYRREFYGRVSSILRQIEDEILFLKEARRKISKFPDIKDLPTIVIAGAPNVGKSTLLRALTGAKPKIESYPFTTKRILLGYFEHNHRKYQVVDTPGLLDRAIEKRNPVERQAILALRYLAQIIIFLFDITEICGYPIDYQLRIFNEVSSLFNVEVLPIVNKADITEKKKIEEFRIKFGRNFLTCSALQREGIEDIKREILKKMGEL